MISARHLTKRYGHQTVLNSISVDFRRGRVSYLLGPNGSGKTTLFKCLLGLENYSGAVRYNGRHLAEVRGQVFPVFDDCALYPQLSGLENLRFLLGRSVGWEEVQAVVKGTLDETDMHRPSRTLSNGQRKKVYAVGLLLARPSYVFLDELANGLDYDSLQWLKEVIEELRKDSVVIASGHQFEFYERVADDVFAISQNGLKKIDFHHTDGDRLEDAYATLRANRPR
ncbi:ATP-binding cassette domain-containing protein [Streptomyces sp. NBC_01283]|uniref:ATP-binding cassette domain-containing protein n=1 Tax=Streptomyces sp. NBC_01283 TaxID=2903812 RepID=UPI00352E50BD|nr:ATP-binding cassette domain-containing protein [Streptomyces sp. NBC_01283]